MVNFLKNYLKFSIPVLMMFSIFTPVKVEASSQMVHLAGTGPTIFQNAPATTWSSQQSIWTRNDHELYANAVVSDDGLQVCTIHSVVLNIQCRQTKVNQVFSAIRVNLRGRTPKDMVLGKQDTMAAFNTDGTILEASPTVPGNIRTPFTPLTQTTGQSIDMYGDVYCYHRYDYLQSADTEIACYRVGQTNAVFKLFTPERPHNVVVMNKKLVVVFEPAVLNAPMTVKVWDLTTSQQLGIQPNVSGVSMFTFAVNPQGDKVVWNGYDYITQKNNLYEWNVTTNQVTDFGLTEPSAVMGLNGNQIWVAPRGGAWLMATDPLMIHYNLGNEPFRVR